MLLKIICILICLCNSAFAQEWGTPKFYENSEVQDQVEFKDTENGPIINMHEGITDRITVAFLNYKGSNPPTIKFIQPSASSNTLLGAVIERKDTNSDWELKITKEQDFETAIIRFVFEVYAADSIGTVYLNIINLDDEKPFIEILSNPCVIEENILGDTECFYKITDPDGIMNNVADYELFSTGMPNINDIFEMVNQDIIQNGLKEWTTMLKVKTKLDFETLPSYIFDFSVTDSGGAESTTKIVVEVRDKPDTPPVWRKIITSLTISEKEQNTFNVLATDGDVGIDASISYSISSEWPELFKIDENGLVTIEKIDRDELAMELFSFEITAYEVDDTSSYIVQSVTVVVEDKNDHFPKITVNTTEISIPENKVTTLPIHVEIKDLDLGNNAKYKVSLVENKYSSAFQIVPHSAYQTATFSISVVDIEPLDYEDPEWQNIELIIRSEEEYEVSQFDEVTIRISLTNWNDESPIFTLEEYNSEVPEGVGLGHKIIKVLAEDKDVDDGVMYTLMGNEINRMFTIDDDGLIKTKIADALDYEKQEMVFIQVSATDTLEPPYHKVFAQVTIAVQDVNDVQPSIRLGPEPISITENKPLGTVINTNTEITASDEDTKSNLRFSINWDNSYGIKNGQSVNVDEWISVETDFDDNTKVAKAELKVNEKVPGTLDYEMFDTMYVELVITDLNQTSGVGHSEVQIVIKIEDENDNPPVFVDDTINSAKSVIEGAEKNTIVGTIATTDKDGMLHNHAVYSLTPEEGTPGWIDIHPERGDLFVIGTIDADKPIYDLNYTVKATNEELFEEAKITIKVIDKNTKSPECTYSKTVHILEKSPKDTVVPANIICKDKDRDEAYNTPWFRFSSSAETEKLFRIDTFTGIIYVNTKDDDELDRDEGVSRYTITFIVSDNYNAEGTQQNMNDYTFDIILDDVNDNPPIIATSSISGSENMNQGSTLGSITAKDIDEPNTDATKISFEVLGIEKGSDGGADPPTDLFYIEVTDDYSGDGNLITNYPLTGFYGTYIVEVKAFDFGNNPAPQSFTKKIDVVIEKYNFKPPIFIYPADKEFIFLSKKQEIGQPLYQYNGELLNSFVASDQQNEKWDIIISIDPESNPNGIFTLRKSGKSEATLMLTSSPTSSSITLKLIANCNCYGKEPYTSSITINVRFIDIDTEPEYTVDFETLEYLEGTTDIVKQLPKAFFNTNEEDWELFTVYYFLVDDISGAFEIGHTSAELKLVGTLDREQMPELTLKVVTSKNANGNPSPEKNSILDVFITVNDVNDNPPNFNKSEYYAGVQSVNSLGSEILVITAYDLDIIDNLEFSIIPETLKPNGSGINAIEQPFLIRSETEVVGNNVIGRGSLRLNFNVQTNMNGYFTFDVKVMDDNEHEVTSPVKIYIVSESSKVTFQFSNNITTVIAKQDIIQSVFEDVLPYRCNIENIVVSSDDEGNPMSDRTDVLTHFVDNDSNEAVSSSIIEQMLSDVQTLSQLQSQLLENGLYILSYNNNVEVDNTEEMLRVILISVSVVLGTFSIVLIIAFIVKTRSLKSRLNKLSVPKFGSQESGLNRVGLAAPNTNKHAIEGSNPVYSEDKKVPQIDRYSIGSGDSDLIGIEDNPQFEYKNDIKDKDSINSLFKDYKI